MKITVLKLSTVLCGAIAVTLLIRSVTVRVPAQVTANRPHVSFTAHTILTHTDPAGKVLAKIGRLYAVRKDGAEVIEATARNSDAWITRQIHFSVVGQFEIPPS